MLLEEMSICISWLPKEVSPSLVWMDIIQSIEGLSSTGRIILLFLFELWYPYSPAFRHWHSWFPGFWTRTRTCTPGPHFLSLCIQTSLQYQLSLFSSLIDHRSWDSSMSISMWVNFYNKSLYICISPIGSVSLGTLIHIPTPTVSWWPQHLSWGLELSWH